LTAGSAPRFDNRAQCDYHRAGMIVFYWSARPASSANNATRRWPLHIHTQHDVGGLVVCLSVTAGAGSRQLR